MREDVSYSYSFYFKLTGGSTGRYSKQMFNSNATRPMIAVKKFNDKGFEIGRVIKGKNAL